MPVTRPAYGRKLQSFVTAPDFRAKKAAAKAAAEKVTLAAAVAVVTTTIVS